MYSRSDRLGVAQYLCLAWRLCFSVVAIGIRGSRNGCRLWWLQCAMTDKTNRDAVEHRARFVFRFRGRNWRRGWSEFRRSGWQRWDLLRQNRKRRCRYRPVGQTWHGSRRQMRHGDGCTWRFQNPRRVLLRMPMKVTRIPGPPTSTMKPVGGLTNRNVLGPFFFLAVLANTRGNRPGRREDTTGR